MHRMAAGRERWNHNIHYHPAVLAALPGRGTRALDVGCGEGILTRDLAARFDHVLGIDIHEPSIERARRTPTPPHVEYLVGDFLTEPLAAASFDAIACVAALHHMDTVTGLERMRGLLREGGTLAVLGLARSRYPRDLPRDAAAAVATRLLRNTGGRELWVHSAPIVWPPPETFAETRRAAEQALPGAQFRRLLLWRYLLTWTKPGVESAT
jgi:2-polyprenyl-3-methyl-5-hydroxy-6-metoxy-1,4-benzoquinol methylase